ncbi:uncharacterized protein LOC132046561 isoform X2 [Lycium ferocissimum]|uniref:uncharacterized protein LOC132046561 isoform X2 n=1 Tax=Lycium ferocissimum TaxID=112874 RepID=UPI002814B7DA|nr:uncharacterized protein LOC132046561 isoform X2 [Lycium ferocissimum]
MAPKNLTFKIILGSSSMARRKILVDMGYEFTLMTADIDEKSIRKDNAEELVVALAEAKADAIMSRLKTTDHLKENTHPTLLITADTNGSFWLYLTYIYWYRGGGIPRNYQRKAIKLFWWSSHGCGICCCDQPDKGDKKRSLGKVYFHDIPDEVIDSLIEEGIILNVAGGLMLEHPLTLPFVDTVIGTADSVMGLPRSLTEKLIQEAL